MVQPDWLSHHWGNVTRGQNGPPVAWSSSFYLMALRSKNTCWTVYRLALQKILQSQHVYSETGILPSLAERLKIILRDELGELAIEETEIVVQSRSPRILADNFRKFTENINLGKTVQTLIAVA